MKHLQEILDQYVLDQNNAELNYKLAAHYLRLNQRVASSSYFLKAAELTDNDDIKFYSLLRIAYNYLSQKDRLPDADLMASYASAVQMNNPKPYAVRCITACFENRWIDLYNIANTGIQLLKSGLLDNISFDEYYIDPYAFYTYLGYAQLHLGMPKEAEKSWNIVYNNTKNLGCKIQATNMLSCNRLSLYAVKYTKDKLSRFKYRFDGLDRIDHNYSQCMQDMFILSEAVNPLHGTYLEIGSADPEFDSNTKLLEEFGWDGLSIDYDQDYVNRFKQSRRNDCIQANALDINYSELISKVYRPIEFIDYLQVDIDPNVDSLNVLKKVIESGQKFGIVTFEHDYYNNEEGNEKWVKDEAIKFMESNGYELVVNNVSMCESRYFEDWFIHKEYNNKKQIRNLSVQSLVTDLFYEL